MSSYFNFTVIIEWCTFIAAIFLLDKKTGIWRLFILFLLLGICTETVGWYMYNFLKIKYNALPFNFFMLARITFLMWFFTKAKLLKNAMKILFAGIALFLVFGLINLFFFQGFWHYNFHTESLGDIILSLVCCYFLLKVVKSDEGINLLGFDYFWLAIGVLFYSLGFALLYQFADLLGAYYKATKINIGNYINYALNLIFYSCLIIAFICRRRITRLL